MDGLHFTFDYNGKKSENKPKINKKIFFLLRFQQITKENKQKKSKNFQ